MHLEGSSQETALHQTLGEKSELQRVKVCYGASRYSSHTRAARANRELIRRHCQVVNGIDAADIVFLHFEPHTFRSLFETYPALRRKYLVGYCVWEASGLPPVYQEAISHVQEIWTCSRFCCEIFARHHPQVKYVPHVIERDTTCTEADRAYIKRIISYDPKHFYFLTVTKLWDLRKNTKALATAFQRQRSNMPKARLIIKAGPEDAADWLPQDGVTVIREHLNEAHMNALYEIANVYVSPHHSEGWGLTLSDAMIFQKPTIATGYSGNCEFMNSDNSFLLKFVVDQIKPEDCFSLFDQSMRWAYPCEEDLEENLLFVYQKQGRPECQRRVQTASLDIKQFDDDTVAAIVEQRIIDTVSSERFSGTITKR